uniref:Uncharacterized protein n=1 Tax=Cucumis sativus TaxID=3659 RepID=A0A0A0LX17_CUCSA
MQNLSSQPLHSQSSSQSLPFQFASPSLSATLSIFISISLLVPLNRHLHLCSLIVAPSKSVHRISSTSRTRLASRHWSFALARVKPPLMEIG